MNVLVLGWILRGEQKAKVSSLMINESISSSIDFGTNNKTHMLPSVPSLPPSFPTPPHHRNSAIPWRKEGEGRKEGGKK